MPELAVRKMLRSLGHSIRTNAKELPGSPDIVARSRRKIVLVHGCFWHRHRGCMAASIPGTNLKFWKTKFDANIARDRRDVRQLRRLGYSVLTVWECQVKSPSKLARLVPRLQRFFDDI